jgi:hypothetical protein
MTRERLDNRRPSEILGFEALGLLFTRSVSRYPDGRPAEVFIDNHKCGSAVGTLARDMAIAVSFALQHGADVEVIRRALCRDGKGRPLGVLLDLIVEDSA